MEMFILGICGFACWVPLTSDIVLINIPFSSNQTSFELDKNKIH